MRARKSAIPDGAGKVVWSISRKRNRVTLAPVLLVNVRRIVSVPNVELFPGSEVKSRTRFGGLDPATQGSSKVAGTTELRSIGLERFSGPGAPRRCPAPAEVPFVSTKMKSVALLSVSTTAPLEGHGPKVVIDPLLPQLSR